MKKKRTAGDIPSSVVERLQTWGATIRKQRVSLRMTAEDLCGRLGISRPTLRRLENGDTAAAASLYLAALNVLGLLDHAAPRLEGHLWEMQSAAPRASGNRDRSMDDDYF